MNRPIIASTIRNNNFAYFEQRKATNMKERRPLTEAEKVWADRLKRIYNRKKNELGFTQLSLAHECGWNTQSSVSNYLNKKIPLNMEAKLKFAKALQVHVSEIDPSMSEFLGQDIQEQKKGIEIDYDALPQTVEELFDLIDPVLDRFTDEQMIELRSWIDAKKKLMSKVRR